MNSIIDASAILAYLQMEKGHDVVEAAFDAGPAYVTTVNACEVLGKLCEKGMPIEEAHAAFDDLGMSMIDFDAELALLAAAMRVRTIPIGASLGDRACLALVQRMTQANTPIPAVYTAEHAWTKLKWPFKIMLIRSARNTV